MKILIILSLILLCSTSFSAQTTAETPAPSVPPAAVATEAQAAPTPLSVTSGVKASSEKPAENPAAPESSSPRYVAKDAPVNIPRFENAPVIDGVLNDKMWENAAVFGDFLQTSPGDNVKPTHQTEFMMGYDAKHLYMAF